MKEKKSFELEVLHPTKSEKFPVLWIEVEGIEGSFLLGPDHAPLISIIKSQSVVLYKSIDGKEKKIDVFSGGMVEVLLDNKTRIILDN